MQRSVRLLVSLLPGSLTCSNALLTAQQVLESSQPVDWRPLNPENTLYLELPTGRVVIELAPAFAPRHVHNIKALVREGYFNGLSIIRSWDNYVVQWGEHPFAGETPARPIRTAKRTLAAEFTVPISKDIPFTPLPDADGYAPQVGFSNSLPAGRDPDGGRTWLCHCYGMVGVGRRKESDSGGGTMLYVVIGHAPRNFDRNVAVVGRVMHGIELLSTLPRGTGVQGFYEKPEQMLPIKSMRIAADVPPTERLSLEVMRTDTQTFMDLVESQRNPQRGPYGGWFKASAGYVDLCSVPIMVRSR